MAIATLDGVLAGMQPPVEFVKVATPALTVGRAHSLHYLAGIPGAGTAPATGVGGSALTALAGELAFANPSAGLNSYLARLQACASQPGVLLLCDRLWHNSGLSVTLTTAQTVNSAAFPARDSAGTANGDQVYIGVEVVTATGAGVPTLTVGYTNQSGVAGKTATNVLATAATSPIGAFYQIGLAAGDTGVRSVQTYQQSATWTSGALSLVAYRILARLELTAANVPNAIDALTSGFPRLYNDTVPFLLFIPSVAAAATVSGQMVVTQG